MTPPQTIEHFKDTYDLKPTSVRNFKSIYTSEISRKRKLFDSDDSKSLSEITELKHKKGVNHFYWDRT
jgi:hypothetical protein